MADTTVARDTFTDVNGTQLNVHTPTDDIGAIGGWQGPCGPFVAQILDNSIEARTLPDPTCIEANSTSLIPDSIDNVNHATLVTRATDTVGELEVVVLGLRYEVSTGVFAQFSSAASDPELLLIEIFDRSGGTNQVASLDDFSGGVSFGIPTGLGDQFWFGFGVDDDFITVWIAPFDNRSARQTILTGTAPDHEISAAKSRIMVGVRRDAVGKTSPLLDELITFSTVVVPISRTSQVGWENLCRVFECELPTAVAFTTEEPEEGCN